MGKELVIVVDYQVDFAAPDGALSAGAPALAIESYLDGRISRALSDGGDVVLTLDTHEAETWAAHPESKAFPPHCRKFERGWQIHGKLAKYVDQPNVSAIEKAAYCPDFRLLERWVQTYDTIEVMGLVTHICVLHTAIGLYTAKVNLGCPVRLIVREEGCASFDPDAHAFALAHMLNTLDMRP